VRLSPRGTPAVTAVPVLFPISMRLGQDGDSSAVVLYTFLAELVRASTAP
jgi:hypothetical protein